MDCARHNNYTDAYVNRGVMFVERYDETKGRAMYGIRDRYRVVVSPEYEKIGMLDWEDHVVKAQNEKGKWAFDIASGN